METPFEKFKTKPVFPKRVIAAQWRVWMKSGELGVMFRAGDMMIFDSSRGWMTVHDRDWVIKSPGMVKVLGPMEFGSKFERDLS